MTLKHQIRTQLGTDCLIFGASSGSIAAREEVTAGTKERMRRPTK